MAGSRTFKIQVTVPVEAKNKLDAIARTQNRTLSNYCAYVLLAHLDEQKKPKATTRRSARA